MVYHTLPVPITSSDFQSQTVKLPRGTHLTFSPSAPQLLPIDVVAACGHGPLKHWMFPKWVMGMFFWQWGIPWYASKLPGLDLGLEVIL